MHINNLCAQSLNLIFSVCTLHAAQRCGRLYDVCLWLSLLQLPLHAECKFMLMHKLIVIFKLSMLCTCVMQTYPGSRLWKHWNTTLEVHLLGFGLIKVMIYS